MTQEDRFLRRLWPNPVRIFGTELTMLTIGQLMLLRRVWNPFGRALPLDQTQYGPGDVAVALYVLSRPWRAAWRPVVKRGLWFRLQLFGKTPWTVAQEAIAAVMISEHIADALKSPPVVKIQTTAKSSPGLGYAPSKQLGAPFWMFRLWQLTSTGMALDKAMDVPVAWAVDSDGVRREVEGIARWATEKENDIAKMVKEQSEELRKLADEIFKPKEQNVEPEPRR